MLIDKSILESLLGAFWYEFNTLSANKTCCLVLMIVDEWQPLNLESALCDTSTFPVNLLVQPLTHTVSISLGGSQGVLINDLVLFH